MKEKAQTPVVVDVASEFLSSNLRLDFRKGHLDLVGHRVMLFRFEFLVAIQKQLEDTIGPSAKGVMYLAGERAAKEVLPAMADRIKDLPPGRGSFVALRGMSDVWAMIGVGRATVTEFSPEEGKFAFRIEHGAFPFAYGRSLKPVCHVWAGWAAGVARQLFERGASCEEVRCLAAGDEACDFVITPRP
jgi:predicted hydrocarbon binding protein